ncbi:hypothetical protein ANCCAN_13432 [Ancylostoma caninum]|uniref:Uncharacterized protein n=1 Tax=Ancylostoma caninum TaxID=29170 RepID=A0A368G870_ANCCA|nr:hypothetical protein ANCCAN_13432 [Ancylostoma caninum]
MYARPYTKCGPFVLGILLGTATFSMKPRLDRATSRLIASAFFALCVCVIYAIMPQYWYGDYLMLYNLYYRAAFRTVFALCGIILAFFHYRKANRTHLCGRCWHVSPTTHIFYTCQSSISSTTRSTFNKPKGQ